ncbi:sigma-70 family RNA polymerase sigma factor [Chryseobacterium camelliae]|uniref:RNA polymerase sigma factor n=1 Tax=Chryseobacterium camelliae TaxID=1265445 RepID=A0ABY7QNY2_9FLAO|nr:sigma-70 family RNA polymerase sigma factor [Chryseobacterium camelliae]WBV61384.1 sigma-70 family RNA polymerase sigma factor [Chryseobacterium camelliae]
MQNILNWQKIYLDHSPKLLGICRRYITDLQTAEDILQDSFMMAIQKNHQLKDEKAIFPWLKKIVVNNALQSIRKTTKDPFINIEPSEIPDPFTEMTTSANDETKHILAYNFTSEELLKSIDNLPPHHKSVFNLYYIENYSHAEISNLLKIPVNTSKSHLMRAKKFVQNYLLTHFVTKETPKNKTAQLLVFLGFGGLLWAQTFQNKFSDFSVSPSKNFEIPADLPINTITFSSNNSWKQKVVIGSTLFIIIVGSILLFNPKNSLITTFNSHGSDAESEEKRLSTNEVKTDQENKIDQEEALKDSSISRKSNSEAKKNSEPDNPSSFKTKNLVSSKTIIKKDSAESVSHKVIVVKKIIQRDTIYVER